MPSDPHVATMTCHGIVLTAVCGALWLVIFNNARVGYQENVNQMRIVSAMVTAIPWRWTLHGRCIRSCMYFKARKS